MPVQPTDKEDEYFAQMEIRRRLEKQAQEAQALAEEDKRRLKELHFMHCPKCGANLQQESMEGVSVDICPACRGIWLDEGELEHLTEAKQGVVKSLRKLLRG